MSWVEELIDVYEKNSERVGRMEYKVYRTKNGEEKIPYVLLPPLHTTVAAQITVVIDEDGNFINAVPVENDEKLTIIPVTEKSGSRTAGKEPHPFCDNLKYLAGDYEVYCKSDDKDNGRCYQLYIQGLKKWYLSEYSHKKVGALYQYLIKKTLIQDLLSKKVLILDENGHLSEKEKIQGINQNVAFVRFCIRENWDDYHSEVVEECWKDKTLMDCFIRYYRTLGETSGLCYLSGKQEPISYLQPKKIRNEGDGAKLISANDKENYTFRGRFIDKEQAFAIGAETSQKAHNALKWLIRKQGHSFDTLSMITWESDLKPMPQWDQDTDAICDNYEENMVEFCEDSQGDEWSGNSVEADRFYSAMEGYGRQFEQSSRMILMAFDAATTGRLALMEYKSLDTSRYLENIKKWHKECEWIHTKRKEGQSYKFLGMVGVKDIADILFGTESNGSLTIIDQNSKKLYSRISRRLLPCIWDARPLPSDFVSKAILRASNPQAYKERYNWERILTLACSFIKKQRKEQYDEEEWNVALNTKCEDRSYLYGRLLAVADRVEYRTFDKEKDKARVTNAKRYMSTFSQRPFETWKVIEENLQPYFNKLKIGERRYYENLIDKICQLFTEENFKENGSLDGLYLLGFHSQSYELKNTKIEENEGGNES